MYTVTVVLVAACVLSDVAPMPAEADDDLKGLQEACLGGNLVNDPCAFACWYKGLKMINENGMFDPEGAKEYIDSLAENNGPTSKAFVKRCSYVNTLKVTDGTRGCQRGKLLNDCLTGFLYGK